MTHRVTVGLRSSFQTRPEQRIEELWRIAAGPIRRARAQNRSGLRVTVAPIHLIVELTSLRPKSCVDRLVSSDERSVTPILVLRVCLIHEPVALAKIKISCSGEKALLPPCIVLVVFSFCDAAASSNIRLVMPKLVLRVSLSHEPVALANINSFAAVRKIFFRLGSGPGARSDGSCLKILCRLKLKQYRKTMLRRPVEETPQGFFH